MTLNEANRKARYLQLCVDTPSAASTHRDSNSISAPLFSWSVREILHPDKQLDRQHALLGHVTNDTEEKEPVLLNTEHPWSAFICGSQGSGKSYTTSCILEGCLSRNKNIGTLKQPMAGLVFRYDRYGSGICEAATLCTGSAAVKVQISLSPFNYKTMESKYRSVSANEEMLQIKPFYLKSKYLNAERIQKFMASGDGFKPLYMSVVDKVLRDMGLENQGPDARYERMFLYSDFKARMAEQKLTDAQRGPLDLRLSLLDSYMQKIILPSPSSDSDSTPDTWQRTEQRATTSKSVETINDLLAEDTLTAEPGVLKILDLTDPHVDRAGACALFDLALAVFMPAAEPKVVALDEAHNYLTQGEESYAFTEDLLKGVREQRHTGSRLIIATQEPSIATRFLDLCTMTIVHRFTSPEWFRALRGHLGGASAEAGVDDEKAKALFKQIGKLGVGQSLVFAPTAIFDVVHGEPAPLEFKWKLMKTRKRISNDGGSSVLAQDR